MGQLEKYGLYVLCLVIFLILGVTIWGGGELPPEAGRRGRSTSADLKVPAPAAAKDVGKAVPAVLPDLDKLMNAAVRKPDPKPAEVAEIGPQKTGESRTAGGATPPVAGEQPGPAASPAARQTHKIRSGDSFESISRQYFGSPLLRTEIARLNARLEPTRLALGQLVVLPTAAEASAVLDRQKPKAAGKVPAGAGAASAAPGTYRIVTGDTLEGIALRELGSRSRLADLQEANPGLDSTRLKLGSTIKLPKK